MSFNENTRVKIPAILHLCKLDYKYLSLKTSTIDESTNIFTDIFSESVKRINSISNLDESDIKRLLEDIILELDNEDLGQEFYDRLINTSGIKLIDFKDFDNNSFHVVTELTCKNGEDEFRPDITLLINGMPLVFIEVKKPDNQQGVIAERNRINDRFKNEKFRKFINISQLLIFSNNMEYDTESIEPIQGAFYSSTSYSQANFNCFREEEKFDLAKLLLPEDEDLENFVLKDNNLLPIKHSPEFLTNKETNTPTNRTLTSLVSRDRLRLLLKYGIAYVQETKGLEKHIMRYPQFFATKAIEQKLESGINKGIIWHTQGSGKTALSFYNVKYLTDYFQRKGVVPKFYFIVDRIDLLNQAKSEFENRSLTVHIVNSKDDLLKDFRSNQAIHNFTGNSEITVVNIHKFKDDTDVLRANDYSIDIQRIYFLDEVHRSYNPTGSFLANLFNSDKKAILIGLTGTPLIGRDRHSTATFGDYIHKYYYNASIADGYTLKLIREGIETNYQIQLQRALEVLEAEVEKGSIKKEDIFSHEKYVEPMLDYIVKDFVGSRNRFNDHSIGGMVVCDSSDQAKKLFEIFINKYNPKQKYIGDVEEFIPSLEVPEEIEKYQEKRQLTASLILHDIGTKQERKDEVGEYKDGNVDLLFVYNMLLTGFDAKRLKKLYVARQIKDHNLLQTLTRVNRPYKDFQYGYVVDFADIRSNFEKTNKAYLDELQAELGDEFETYSNLFKSKEEIEEEIKEIKETLFQFDLENREEFSRQLDQIEDKQIVLEIKKALQNTRNLYNLIRLFGQFELLEKLDFRTLSDLFIVAQNRLNFLNLKDSLKNNAENINLLNEALENVIFTFHKVSEEEMIIADQLRETLRKTRESLLSNFDKKDVEFVKLYDELKRLFADKNLDELTQEDMKANIASLEHIYIRIKELNRNNNDLKKKYQNDPKYARLHKRIFERGDISKRHTEIYETLTGIKKDVDGRIILRRQELENQAFFRAYVDGEVIKRFDETKVLLRPDSADFVTNHIVKEYINEYKGIEE